MRFRHALLLCAACACMAQPRIEKPVQPGKFLSAHGRRAALPGFEDGRLEAWIFPIKLLRDFRLSVCVDQALAPIPFSELAETAIVHPHAASIVHLHPAFTVRQTWVASPEKPLAAVLLEVESSRPLRFHLSFTPEMQPMWPASFGGQSTP